MQDEMTRLLDAIQQDETLRRAMEEAGDFGAQLRVAAAHGYRIELGDELLDGVVGGKGGSVPSPNVPGAKERLDELLANLQVQQGERDGLVPPDPFGPGRGPIPR